MSAHRLHGLSVLEKIMIVVKPSDISVTDHFWNAFDNSETEVSARWLVRFMQDNGDTWAPFKLADLQQYYAVRRVEQIYKDDVEKYDTAQANKAKWPDNYVYIPPRPKKKAVSAVESFYFNRLYGDQYDREKKKTVPMEKYMKVRKGRYQVTEEFVRCVFRSAGVFTMA